MSVKKAHATVETLVKYPEVSELLNLEVGTEFEYDKEDEDGDPIPKDPTKG